MANIPEHYSKLKWESDDCEYTRIDFSVQWDAIGVNYDLEPIGEEV